MFRNEPKAQLRVAFIPDDEASRGHITKLMKDYVEPLRVVLYCGPYVIRATLMMTYKWPLEASVSQGSAFAYLTDAEIDNQLPGARLTGFRASHVILHTEALQGWHAA